MQTSQEQNNVELIELQSLNGGEENSSNKSETKPENQDIVSVLKISPLLIPMILLELGLSIADVLSDTWTGFSLLKLQSLRRDQVHQLYG